MIPGTEGSISTAATKKGSASTSLFFNQIIGDLLFDDNWIYRIALRKYERACSF